MTTTNNDDAYYTWDENAAMLYSPSDAQIRARQLRQQLPLPAGAPADAHDYIREPNGDRLWLNAHNQIHRDGGLPAMMYTIDGVEGFAFFENGKLHNLVGRSSTNGLYHIRGVNMSEEDFKNHPEVIAAQKAAMTISTPAIITTPKLKFQRK